MRLDQLLVLLVAHQVRVAPLADDLVPIGVGGEAVHGTAVLRIRLEHIERLRSMAGKCRVSREAWR